MTGTKDSAGEGGKSIERHAEKPLSASMPLKPANPKAYRCFCLRKITYDPIAKRHLVTLVYVTRCKRHKV